MYDNGIQACILMLMGSCMVTFVFHHANISITLLTDQIQCHDIHLPTKSSVTISTILPSQRNKISDL